MPAIPGAVLFDADGVVQHTPTLRTHILQLVPDEAFLSAVFAAEVPTLTGAATFEDTMARLIDDRSLPVALPDLLAAWTAIEVDTGVVNTVAALRDRGHRCYLATNQNDFRAAHLREHLGYDSIFDGQFYSCELRVAKPEVGFFSAIADHLALAPEDLLFFDDSQRNVDGARRAGLAAELFTPQTDIAAIVRNRS